MKGLAKNKKIILAALVVFLLALIFLAQHEQLKKEEKGASFLFPPPDSSEKEILEETSSMKKSDSPDWWVNSGGFMTIEKNEFSTNIGSLPKNNKWRKLYAKNNSRDTDGGYYPQNIFRLVTRKKWRNLIQTLYFKIDKNNLSGSQYRNESNGVLLFNRYQDGDNLYYTGLRVDGQAVIKKKSGGKYYTLAEKEVFTESREYDRVNNPNLIPQDRWLGIKSEVNNTDDTTVDIKFYVDKGHNGDWQLVLETKDKNDKYGKTPFLEEGYAGIRTDFMDVTFKDYSIKEN